AGPPDAAVSAEPAAAVVGVATVVELLLLSLPQAATTNTPSAVSATKVVRVVRMSFSWGLLHDKGAVHGWVDLAVERVRAWRGRNGQGGGFARAERFGSERAVVGRHGVRFEVAIDEGEGRPGGGRDRGELVPLHDHLLVGSSACRRGAARGRGSADADRTGRASRGVVAAGCQEERDAGS